MPYANTGSVGIAPKRKKLTINLDSGSSNAVRREDEKRKPHPVIVPTR